MKYLTVRLMMAGSCHPHSGKIVSFQVPFEPDHTVDAVLHDVIEPQWPQEAVPLEWSSLTAGLLKGGVRLDPDHTFASYLSVSEEGLAVDSDPISDHKRVASMPIVDCNDKTSSPAPSTSPMGDLTNTSVLMHLFFRRKREPRKKAEPNTPKKTESKTEGGCQCSLM